MQGNFLHCILLFLSYLCLINLEAAAQHPMRNSIPTQQDSVYFQSSFEYPQIPTTGHRFQYWPDFTGSPWTFSYGSGYALAGSYFLVHLPQQVPDSAQVLFLQNQGQIEKSLTLPAGYYQVEVLAAQRITSQTSSQTVEFRIDGNLEMSLHPDSGGVYESFKKIIYLPGGQHLLKFKGLSQSPEDNSIFLDQFKLTRLQDVLLSDFESPLVTTTTGFEHAPPAPNWTFANGGGFCREGFAFAKHNPARDNGDQVLYLQSYGHASLNLDIPADGMYRFRFDAALRGQNPTQPCQKIIRVTVDGVIAEKFLIPSTDYTEMVTLPMYLTAGSHTLTLKGLNPASGDHSALVDDLRMEPLLDWQDPYSWQGGQVPGPHDVAMVIPGSAMAMRGTMHAASVMVHGNLFAAQNQDFTLFNDRLMVMGMGATLQVGSELAPYLSQGQFNLTALPNEPGHMHMGNNFVGAMHHAVIHLHGKERVSWTRLNGNVAKGTTQIVLAEPVDWQAGDHIVIVSSNQRWSDAEECEVQQVSTDSLTLTLTHPLDTNHCGIIKTYDNGAQIWTADLRAEVGLLTHNIKIQAVDTAATNQGYGGHTMIMEDAKAYCSGIELYHMGQKTLKGRYPWHWHMLAAAGQGQYFKNSSVHHSFNRAVTIHGTDYTLVENNFLYDHIGHGVFLEDGGERFNTIRKNVALLTRKPKPGEEVIPSDNQFNPGEVQNRTPATYWITNPQNTFEDNVAAGTEGTGYWFALPFTPLNASKTHPYYAHLKPYKLPLGSFKGNSAHSCKTGFDIFDHVNDSDQVVRNGIWDNHTPHVMENCTWYANDMALYAASAPNGPSDNLVWKNNVLVENRVGSMIAAQSRIENSVIVAHTGEGLLSGHLYAYRVYDGPGQVRNSHFVGWSQPNTSFFRNTGAALKHVNHRFANITFDPANTPVNAALADYDLPPSDTVQVNGPRNPRMWIFVLRDSLGDFGGGPASSIVSNHPFLLTGNETAPTGWTNIYHTPNQYVLGRITHNNGHILPDVTLSREKNDSVEEQLYLLDGFKQWTKAPLIVNQDYLYTYDFDALPSNKFLLLSLDDGFAGDEVLLRFKDFGKLGGLVIENGTDTLTDFPASSLAALKSQSQSGIFLENNGDLYLKGVIVPGKKAFTMTWTSGFNVTKPDSDGDGMADGDEVRKDRHPFDAADLAVQFEDTNNSEGWGLESNLINIAVADGQYQGTGMGDAMMRNHSYHFAANRVPRLYVRIKTSVPTMTEFFYRTDVHPAYSAARAVRRFTAAADTWETLEFDFSGAPDWAGTITSLRLDPVSGNGIDFEIDWIRAQCPDSVVGCPGNANKWAATMDQKRTNKVLAYPNPFTQEIHLQWEKAGAYTQVDLLDLHGKRLHSEALPTAGTTSVLDTRELRLPTGMYILKLRGREGVATLKLFKQL